MKVTVPRTNANEDQVLVVDVLVEEGQAVAEGDVIFTVETTKVTLDVEAPRSGVVMNLVLKTGDVVNVGAEACLIHSTDGKKSAAAATPAVIQETRVTAKARKRALQLGLDESALPTSGIVTVDMVEKIASKSLAPSAKTVIRHDFKMPKDAVKAVINGGSGHAAVVIDALRGSRYQIVGAVDTLKDIGAEVLNGIRIIGREDKLTELLAQGVTHAFIGVGGSDDNRPRQKVYSRLKSLGFVLPPVIHSQAYIAEDVEIGEGCLILPGAVIGPRSRIGANVVVNQGAQVCHDSEIGDHCHLTPGSLIAGHCSIGAYTVVGMAATVLDHHKVGQRCLIHNGAAVTSDIPDDIELARDGRRIRHANHSKD
ncbi:MAG: NeuD/PglB/VioB family sugar acetyltransferase [Pseudomonadales bacterium]|nr:NeuD/PglB/VioB family sugar acetyltransferase [Pseudomonadales bacterium]